MNVNNKNKEIEKCDHLFLKLREGYDVKGFHSTDYYHVPSTIECVKCGLTNKYSDMSIKERLIYSKINDVQNQISLNKRLFKLIDKNSINLISDEALNTNHPRVLYYLAKKISQSEENDEIFKIMKEIYALETPYEREFMKTSDEAINVYNRLRLVRSKK